MWPKKALQLPPEHSQHLLKTNWLPSDFHLVPVDLPSTKFRKLQFESQCWTHWQASHTCLVLLDVRKTNFSGYIHTITTPCCAYPHFLIKPKHLETGCIFISLTKKQHLLWINFKVLLRVQCPLVNQNLSTLTFQCFSSQSRWLMFCVFIREFKQNRDHDPFWVCNHFLKSSGLEWETWGLLHYC